MENVQRERNIVINNLIEEFKIKYKEDPYFDEYTDEKWKEDIERDWDDNFDSMVRWIVLKNIVTRHINVVDKKTLRNRLYASEENVVNITYPNRVSKNSVCHQNRRDLRRVWNGEPNRIVGRLPHAVFHFEREAVDRRESIPRFLNDLAIEIDHLCIDKKENRYRYEPRNDDIVSYTPRRNNAGAVIDDRGAVIGNLN